ncbi:serine--tRNA ligase [Paenibacillus anaericanus]|uniref:Serine--tRNA ligase n=1 Tax=Paenibacillus anaericanus TaxID=170367 RepID=A0A3S1CAP9_9BACL|nr:serine--tRNA ligase [Paenibacillus anaericanus]RUT47693.1 serine--tRNA ligase [Paenibacillus anaericanus]
MLDLKSIRSNAAKVQEAADQKGIQVSVQELISWDDQRRALMRETESLREQRNLGSNRMGALLQAGEHAEAATLRESLKNLNEGLSSVEEKLEETVKNVQRLMLLIPNVPSPDSPIGQSDLDNVEVRCVGELPEWNFVPRNHMELGVLHDIIDMPRGVKVGGARSYYLKGAGLLLHRAVQQLALDMLLERGFTPMEVPLMVREEPLINTGHFPIGQEQTYAVNDADKWLVGTSEVPLVSYYADEVLDLQEPIKLAAVSNCFRSEVGSAGRDVRGLYRVHQFAKVEMVIICDPDEAKSEALLQEITSHAEELLSLLELPYRVMLVCTGDMSQKTYKQYDIETWMPSRETYGETHSSSNLLDFQARRSNIRCHDAERRLVYCHTLNNTAVASPRILIPLLENHQREDGSIYIPPALRKYMGNREVLMPLDVKDILDEEAL